MQRQILIPILLAIIIAISFYAVYIGICKQAKESKDRQAALAAIFGSWPLKPHHALMIFGFYGGLIILSYWLATHH